MKNYLIRDYEQLGVKSINLKDEDFVVMTDVVDSDSSIIMATQRGAVKRISYKILQQAKRAQEDYIT